MIYTKFLLKIIFTMIPIGLLGQEILNVNDINAFILGGDQKSNLATIDLLPISLVDVESDPDNTISFGEELANLEAGQSVLSSSGNDLPTNEDLWLNYTFRSDKFSNGVIRVYTNMPLPNGFQIIVSIINFSPGGDYNNTQRPDPVSISMLPQPIVYSFPNGYTNNGKFNGYQLRYTLSNPNSVSLPDGFQVIYDIVHE